MCMFGLHDINAIVNYGIIHMFSVDDYVSNARLNGFLTLCNKITSSWFVSMISIKFLYR